MKKKILAIAIAMCGMCGLVASAQMPDKSYKPQKFTDFAFEGVLLELDQQAKIDSINALYLPATKMPQGQCQAQAGKQCDKAGKQCDKAATCDSAAQCQGGCKMRQGHAKQQGMRQGQHPGMRQGMGMRPGNMNEYVAAVKEVLTPDQYVTFLENIVTMPAPAPGQAMAPGHRDHKQMDQCQGQGQCHKDKKAKQPKASKDNKAKAGNDKKAKASKK